jgi:hypothetical protein
MSANVRVLAQQDPLANRLRTFGDDLKRAKALTADLETVLKRLDDEASSLTEAGVTMTYTLGPVGDAAGAARRDLEPRDRPTFTMPTGDTRG